MASMTRATTSERRIARNARFTDKASVVLPAEATAALFLIPAVSISLNFWRKKENNHCAGSKFYSLPNHYYNSLRPKLYNHKV